jgi:hypothetical protein
MAKTYREVLIAQVTEGDPLCIDVEACGGFAGACLVVFQKREKAGCYPTVGPVPPTMPPPLVTNDPEDWLAEHWGKIEAEYEVRHNEYKEAVRQWGVFQRARNGDANSASWIIRAREQAEGYQLLRLLGDDGKALVIPEPVESLDVDALVDDPIAAAV